MVPGTAMLTIIVFDAPKKEIIRTKIENPLFWYDPDTQEMLTFTGGALDLVNKVFDKKLNRYVPKVIDVFQNNEKISRSKETTMAWFMRYSNYNNTDAAIVDSGVGEISITVPDKEIDDITYDLERNGIDFRIE